MNFGVTQNPHSTIETTNEVKSSNYPKTFTTAQNCLEFLTTTHISDVASTAINADIASSSSKSIQLSSNDLSNNIKIIKSAPILENTVSLSPTLRRSSVTSVLQPIECKKDDKEKKKEDQENEENFENNYNNEFERKNTLPEAAPNYNDNIKQDLNVCEICNITLHLDTTINLTDIKDVLDLTKNVDCIAAITETESKLNIGWEGEADEETVKLNTNVKDLNAKESTIHTKIVANLPEAEDSTTTKSSDNNSGDSIRSSIDFRCIADKAKIVPLSERVKKTSWYNVFYPNYKSRSQDFKKLFKDIPQDERLIVDYSCALFKDLLVQGRLYVSQNYVCFHANILGWETHLNIKWEDVTSVTKEKTALVIPNAISIVTNKENHFFSSFTARDKTYLILFRVWQNTLMNKSMMPQELWQLVHNYYGEELGLTSDDEDYVDPCINKASLNDLDGNSLEFVSALDDTTSLSIHTSSSNEPKLCVNLNTAPEIFSSSSISQHSNTSASSSGGAVIGLGSGNNSFNHTLNMKSTTKEYKLSSPKAGDSIGLASVLPVRSSGGSCDSGTGSKETKHNASLPETAKRKVSKHTRQRDESVNKNLEAIATDMSDSSDSEENNIPFVATAECNSPHEGRQLVHTILPINIETLFNLLFAKSKFLVDFHTLRKSSDMTFGEWLLNDDGQKTRTVNVTVQLSASVGPKTSKVTEHQVMRDCSKPGELYSIDISSVNAGIPYADSFTVLMHYCLVKTVDDHTMLSVHAQIKYKKSIWGVVKGFIEKNTWAGLEDFYNALLHSLQNETNIPPAKGKGRRPRRGTSTAQIRPLEDLPILQMKIETPEQFHSSHTLAAHLSTENSLIITETPNKYKWLSIFVLILLCFLIAVNVILLLKLWRLEDRITQDMEQRARMPNFAALKQLPTSHEGWIELMRQQEMLHETELKKWHHVLQTAVELLKKTEKALIELMLR